MLRLHPDLVLAARFGAQATVAALTALGLRALHVELPDAVHCPRGVDFGAVSESTGRTIHVLTCYSAAMNVLRRPTMTLEQFLDWEERQEAKYEFNGFEPVLMAGGTEEQAEIQTNILAALRSRLRGHRCRVLGSDLKVIVMGCIRYLDPFVVCSPRERGRTVVTDPVIVFEIISESTQHTDLVEKNDEYRETPSIQRYISLSKPTSAASLSSVPKTASGPPALSTDPKPSSTFLRSASACRSASSMQA